MELFFLFHGDFTENTMLPQGRVQVVGVVFSCSRRFSTSDHSKLQRHMPVIGTPSSPFYLPSSSWFLGAPHLYRVFLHSPVLFLFPLWVSSCLVRCDYPQ
eukprot:RCo048175